MQDSDLYNYSAVLRATGPDSNGFLQGQFSQDVRAPAPASRYGLWLDFKGRVQGDGFVLRLGREEHLIVSYHCGARQIAAHLEKSIVADDVTLTDETLRWRGGNASGEGAAGELISLGIPVPQVGSYSTACGAFCWEGRRTRGANYEVMWPCTAKDSAGAARAEDSEERERWRIEAGIPAVPMDIGPGDLPQEGGLEASAVSFTKGCFLGQEVVARLKNLGQVRRRLMVIRGSGARPAAGTPLFHGDRRIGEVRSAARAGDGFVAMAMISLVNLVRGERLTAEAGAAPTIDLLRPAEG